MKPDYQTLFNTNVQKVKAGTNGQFTGLCPFHNDKNRSLAWNESGLWNCFAGCGSGNAYQFAERLGIDPLPYKNGDMTNIKKTLTPNAKNIKNSRVPEIRRVELSTIDKRQAKDYQKHLKANFSELTRGLPWTIEAIEKTHTGYDPEKKRFTFVHTDQNGKGVNIKWHKTKSKSPFSLKGHGGNRLYPLHLLKAYNPKAPLIYCEGEKDCISLLSQKFQVVTNTTGAGNIPDLEQLKPFKWIIVLLDNDQAGKTGSKKIAESIKKQFPEIRVEVARWPDGSPEKFDVTDFLLKGELIEQMEQFDKILTTAKELRKGYQVLNGLQFEQSNFPKPKPIVEEILTEGGAGTIAGRDNTGKSLLALQFACACALGVPFLDYETAKPFRVLLIQFEDDEGELLHRFKKMKRWFDNIYSPNPNLWEKNISFAVLEKETLLFSDQWERIERTVIESPGEIQVLIIDNLYTSTEKNVSANEDLAPLLGKITEIRRKHRLAVMLINHHTKGTAELKGLDKDMIRGGKVFTDWLTNAVQIAESKLNKDFRVFKVTKLKSGQGLTLNIPQILKFDNENLVFTRLCSIENEALHFVDSKTKPEFEALRKVEPYTKDGVFKTKQFEAVIEEMNYTRKTGFNWLHRLESWKLIKWLGHGKYKILKTELENYTD